MKEKQVRTRVEGQHELYSSLWSFSNDLRGAVDGWDFRQIVLGTLFYRFISENFANYMEDGDEIVDYPNLPDDVLTEELKEDAIKTKGYFIAPSRLFVNVSRHAKSNSNPDTYLSEIFSDIERSAVGYRSEHAVKGLFEDFDTTSTRLGNTAENKNKRLAAVLEGVGRLDLGNSGNFEDNDIDLFGDAYEFLISKYASNAGKSGGEFFTPPHVSKLLARLGGYGMETVDKIYDPAVGSGSLLLQAKKHFDKRGLIEEGFFGQEVNRTSYNLARMNMLLHNVDYDKFNIALGDTLRHPRFGDEKPFDVIVANPPYSVKWIGADDPTPVDDERFAPAGVLAPKSKGDMAFVMHRLHYLSKKGRAAIVCFPGIFYRGGAERKIRKYLVDANVVETVIALAPNLFYGTSIAVNIPVSSKHKPDNKTQFIDVSGEEFFKKERNTNVLTADHIDRIMEMFVGKDEVPHVATSVDTGEIAANDYNLSVGSYVESKDTREIVEDIEELNRQATLAWKKRAVAEIKLDNLVKILEAKNV